MGTRLCRAASRPRAAIGELGVAADSSSFSWGIAVLLFWPVAYPWYLIVRPNVRSGAEQLRTHPTGSITEWLATDPPVEEMFSEAFKFDRRGDWADAIAVLECIAERRKGQQEGEYARNCAQDIYEKIRMATDA